MRFSESQVLTFTKNKFTSLSSFTALSNFENVMLNHFNLNHSTHIDHSSPYVAKLLNHTKPSPKLKPNTKFKVVLNEDQEENLLCIYSDSLSTTNTTTLSTNLNIFDINFLRKEKIYAKLKYSRSPQYDIVSGGLAAILSGFLGFLICEKFGLELLDSGDFYMAFMYGVFIVFTVRPLLRSVSGFKKDGTYAPTFNVLSPQILIHFYKTLLTLLFNLKK